MATTIQKITRRLRGIPGEFLITGDFRTKLSHHFYELTGAEKLVYSFFMRGRWDGERIFFFEGCRGLHGQMYGAERKALFDTIVKYAPRHCFEIGTYTGGGSTFFISSAFEKIGEGKLLTMESNPYLHAKAGKYYREHLPELDNRIEFILGNDTGAFEKKIREYGSVDCVFFDGAEDAQETLRQYRYFLPYFKKGTIIIMHDWNTDKTKALKPVILSDPKWKIVTELRPPESVGMAVAERL